MSGPHPINTVDAMTRDQIVARLDALKKQYPQAFELEMKDVTPDEQGTRGELLELDASEPTEEVVRDTD